MPKFNITYVDPETEEMVEEIREFEDGAGLSAMEWAEDYGYTAADKGYHTVTLRGER